LVDDEPEVLESLRDALRPWRREWLPSFAEGGEDAVALLERERFDVVVSDMRMPGMDGAALLRRVSELQPDAVRIVLSGSADADVLTHAAAVAHQFLAKPCDTDRLARVIGRAAELGDATRDGRLAASEATALPCAPALYAELSALLSCGTAGMGEIAALVERDIAVSAKVLQLANSAFFTLPRAITRIAEAMTFLGPDTLKVVVLSAEALTAFRPMPPIELFSIEPHERRAKLMAGLVHGLMPRGEARGEAVAGAMLHDVGWLILATQEPGRLAELLASAHRDGATIEAVERERGGPTHADVGAHLLELWGMPETIVAAVAHHHSPPAPGAGGLEPVGAVYLGDALLSELETPRGAGVDEGYVAALGLADRLDSWRVRAAEMAAS
jgi:HD-like signal output (HDOD) protein/CheY-like chemotaxis protein